MALPGSTKPEWHSSCNHLRSNQHLNFMKKFKQSCVELVSGAPTKEHYTHAAIGIGIIAIIAGTLLAIFLNYADLAKV
jgi:hypothetical protein